ncbi:hypothetical protein ABN028_15960 [Actinopolymorpha sp. B17G11]|uniref:hypothetical protein n=1 Tax=Actinopolymorpha sp. B17G11 TaxID=3160861 RepID=UPI0032E4EA1D
MGVVYCGAYADLIGDEHEGYAARRLADGTLTGTWTAATAEFNAYVGACGCGWRAPVEREPNEAGEAAALEDWDREHLQLLIAQARRAWLPWAERVGSRARTVAGHVAEGRLDLAVSVAERLEADIAFWRRIAEGLVEEARR